MELLGVLELELWNSVSLLQCHALSWCVMITNSLRVFVENFGTKVVDFGTLEQLLDMAVEEKVPKFQNLVKFNLKKELKFREWYWGLNSCSSFSRNELLNFGTLELFLLNF